MVVGFAMQAANDATFQKIFRDMLADEQDRIAAIAGGLKVVQQRGWDIKMPLCDERGELRVVDISRNALGTRKEVLFSVAVRSTDALTRQWFVTQTCWHPDGQWRCAAAEPAVGR